MNLKDHYTQLRTNVQQGKSPQARLGIFMAGVGGLIEQHPDDQELVKGIGADFRTNADSWNKLIFETRV